MQEKIENDFRSKRKQIIKGFRDRVTLNNWDGSSPIWVYDFFINQIDYVSNLNLIKKILIAGLKPCFSHKENAEIYQWVFSTIEIEISNKLSQRDFSNFVDIKDINHGDKNNAYYTSKGDRDYEKESN